MPDEEQGRRLKFTKKQVASVKKRNRSGAVSGVVTTKGINERGSVDETYNTRILNGFTT